MCRKKLKKWFITLTYTKNLLKNYCTFYSSVQLILLLFNWSNFISTDWSLIHLIELSVESQSIQLNRSIFSCSLVSSPKNWQGRTFLQLNHLLFNWSYFRCNWSSVSWKEEYSVEMKMNQLSMVNFQLKWRIFFDWLTDHRLI